MRDFFVTLRIVSWKPGKGRGKRFQFYFCKGEGFAISGWDGLSVDHAAAQVGRECRSVGSLYGKRGSSCYGAALFAEYEELVQRKSLWRKVPVTAEREALLDDFCAAVRWQPIYFRWRPNLPDADDDHVLELAIAGGVEHLVTHNTRDFNRSELKFASPLVVTPAQHLNIAK
jgi:predicted nucleic acid-binding protein